MNPVTDVLILQERVIFARAQVQGLGLFKFTRLNFRCSGQRIISIPCTRSLYLLQPSVGAQRQQSIYSIRIKHVPFVGPHEILWISFPTDIKGYRNWAMSATSEGRSSPIRSSTWTLGTVNPWGLVSFFSVLGIMRTRLSQSCGGERSYRSFHSWNEHHGKG